MTPESLKAHAQGIDKRLLAGWLFQEYDPGGDENAQTLSNTSYFHLLSKEDQEGFLKQATLMREKPLGEWPGTIANRLLKSIHLKTYRRQYNG